MPISFRCGGRTACATRGAAQRQPGRCAQSCGNVPSASRQTSGTAGTIFQDTRTPLTTWFRAMWAVTSSKTGTSALALQQVLGLGS